MKHKIGFQTMIKSETFCCEETQQCNQIEEGEQNVQINTLFVDTDETVFVDSDEEQVKMSSLAICTSLYFEG